MEDMGILNPEQSDSLIPWEGDVYEAFNLEGQERYEKDVGLRPAGAELPTLIVQSCWEDSYSQMYDEMKQWLYLGNGAVQKAILLKWSLNDPDSIECGLEVYVYDNDQSTRFRRIMQQQLLPTMDTYMPSIKITIGEIFGHNLPWKDLHPNMAYYISANLLSEMMLQTLQSEKDYPVPDDDMEDVPEDLSSTVDITEEPFPAAELVISETSTPAVVATIEPQTAHFPILEIKDPHPKPDPYGLSTVDPMFKEDPHLAVDSQDTESTVGPGSGLSSIGNLTGDALLAGDILSTESRTSVLPASIVIPPLVYHAREPMSDVDLTKGSSPKSETNLTKDHLPEINAAKDPFSGADPVVIEGLSSAASNPTFRAELSPGSDAVATENHTPTVPKENSYLAVEPQENPPITPTEKTTSDPSPTIHAEDSAASHLTKNDRCASVEYKRAHMPVSVRDSSRVHSPVARSWAAVVSANRSTTLMEHNQKVTKIVSAAPETLSVPGDRKLVYAPEDQIPDNLDKAAASETIVSANLANSEAPVPPAAKIFTNPAAPDAPTELIPDILLAPEESATCPPTNPVVLDEMAPNDPALVPPASPMAPDSLLDPTKPDKQVSPVTIAPDEPGQTTPIDPTPTEESSKTEDSPIMSAIKPETLVEEPAKLAGLEAQAELETPVEPETPAEEPVELEDLPIVPAAEPEASAEESTDEHAAEPEAPMEKSAKQEDPLAVAVVKPEAPAKESSEPTRLEQLSEPDTPVKEPAKQVELEEPAGESVKIHDLAPGPVGEPEAPTEAPVGSEVTTGPEELAEIPAVEPGAPVEEPTETQDPAIDPAAEPEAPAKQSTKTAEPEAPGQQEVPVKPETPDEESVESEPLVPSEPASPTSSDTPTDPAVVPPVACVHDIRGPGCVQCDCSSQELMSPHPPQSPADLWAQLQSILGQLQAQTEKSVMPQLKMAMACEATESEDEKDQVVVEVKVKYRGKNTPQHPAWCQQVRGIMGAGGKCLLE
ncbi:hypothetical protein BDD12DRAFT_887099 [Trichophaea hybrida]|nr:hypothetical protein BDD12DRAFT_887099 [Trichophaea hybrida]